MTLPSEQYYDPTNRGLKAEEYVREIYVNYENAGDLDGFSGYYAGADFDAWLKAVRAQAWDEGREAEAEAQFQDAGYGNVQHPENPYRKPLG